jgi:eukaryotic-like serine/threonine-protein kinase
MPLSPGTQLGPYEILAPLGAGGMGEVYRAKDTRLDRTVAIKILPAQLTADPVARQRFEREAKVISNLNHPNICVLHDVGHQDGIDFLVMECVEGESLAVRIEKGPLPVDQVVRYGVQIADALDKAHRSGIVHRDLKPGNIMLTPTGAKLLDFGLAKEFVGPNAPGAALTSLSATLSANLPQSPVTQQGTVLGTFQYMSPEQVEGKELDGRSDIFSLGAVLYEMLTGQRAFSGKTALSVASAIVEREPVPLRELRPLIPSALDHAIRRCLEKDPEQRWQTARDLGIELRWALDAPTAPTSTAAPPEPPKRSFLPWLISAALAIALIAAVVKWRAQAVPHETQYFSAPINLNAEDLAIAPNGRTVAIATSQGSPAKTLIWLYDIGSQDAKPLPKTEGATFPFWSPDSASLAFFADRKLKKIDLAGGPVQTICDAPSGRGGTWNKDGVILFTPSPQLLGGIYRTTVAGETPRPVTKPNASLGESTHRWPMFLPDGKHFLYLAANITGEIDPDAMYVGNLDSPDDRRLVVKTNTNAAYAGGYLFFKRDSTLLAQKFDPDRFVLSGEPFAVITQFAYIPRIAKAVFAVSASHLIVQKSTEAPVSRLTWFDRKGNDLGTVGDPGVYANVALSPDGKSVAVNKTDPANQNTDVWTYNLESGTAKRLTFDPAVDAYPIWGPDGSKIAFSTTRRHVFDLYVKTTDGALQEQPLFHTDVDKFPNSWSPDGKYLLYIQDTDIWYLTLPDLKTTLFVKGSSTAKNAEFSPDGKWVAYASNETGRFEVYVTSFPDAHSKWQVSSSGGEQPRWRKDGKELFYIAAGDELMAIPIKYTPNFDFGPPQPLFQTDATDPISTSEHMVYDVGRDGQRFLVNTRQKRSTVDPIAVVLNWDASLKK